MRTLLVPLTESKGQDGVLGASATVAKDFKAHLTGLFVRPDPRAAIPFMGEGLTADAIQDLVDAAEREGRARASKTQAAFEEAMKEAGIAFGDGLTADAPSADWQETTGMIADRVGRAARLADLTFIPQPAEDASADATELLNETLFRSGRPLLLCPAAAAAAVGRNILLAWNGRAECARTAACALPFLRKAERIGLLTVGEEHPDRPSLEAFRLYLARHKVDGQIIRRDSGSASIGERILEAASETGADMLVMGAFSHSRWREMIIGGVTRYAIHNAHIPVFMSH